MDATLVSNIIEETEKPISRGTKGTKGQILSDDDKLTKLLRFDPSASLNPILPNIVSDTVNGDTHATIKLAKIILKTVSTSPGCDQEELLQKIPSGIYEFQKFSTQLVNELLKLKLLKLVTTETSRDAGGLITARFSPFLNIHDAFNASKLNKEQSQIFNIVAQNDANGIWIKKIREYSTISDQKVPRVLDQLIQLGLVKQTAKSMKKIYYLASIDDAAFNLDTEAWSTSRQPYDQKLLNLFISFAYQIAKTEKKFTPKVVFTRIREIPEISPHLENWSEHQALKLCNFLVYSGFCCVVPRQPEKDTLLKIEYQVVNKSVSPFLSSTDLDIASLPSHNFVYTHDQDPLTSIPCGRCPSLSVCGENDEFIHPSTCRQWSIWLGLQEDLW